MKIDDMITKLQIILDGVIFVLLLSLTGSNHLKSSRHQADGPIIADCLMKNWLNSVRIIGVVIKLVKLHNTHINKIMLM